MSETCSQCGLPKDLCVCETIAKENQSIIIGIEKRKFGKLETTIEGIDNKEIDIKDLAKKLKNKFACGGTVKKGNIELQGNHVQRVKEYLIQIGFAANTIEVKKRY